MRQRGRIYRVDVSAKLLLVFTVFLLAVIVLGVYAINRFFTLRYENKRLHQDLARCSRDLNNSEVLSQYNLLADEMKLADRRNQSQPEPQIERPQTKNPPAKTPQTKKLQPKTTLAVSSPQTKLTQPAGPMPQETLLDNNLPVVDVLNLSIQPERQDTVARFQIFLRNIHPESDVVSGYLFSVLINPNTSPPTHAAFPNVELEDGVPVDYLRGTRFYIKRGKMVRGRVRNLDNADEFSKAQIFIYSQDGQLLLKKVLIAKND